MKEAVTRDRQVRPAKGVFVRDALRVLRDVAAHLLPVKGIEAAGCAMVDGQTLSVLVHGFVPRCRDQQVHWDVHGHDVEDVVCVALHRTEVASAGGDEQFARPVGFLHPAGVRFFPGRANDRHANDGDGREVALLFGEDGLSQPMGEGECVGFRTDELRRGQCDHFLVHPRQGVDELLWFDRTRINTLVDVRAV